MLLVPNAELSMYVAPAFRVLSRKQYEIPYLQSFLHESFIMTFRGNISKTYRKERAAIKI